MKTIQRSPVIWKLSEQQRMWLKNNCCPICGLPKDKWKRRTDWRCCSKECTMKFDNIVVIIWQDFRLKVFQRDNYTCKNCGFESRKEQLIHPDSREYYERKYKIFKIIQEDKDLIKGIFGDESQLIADHIIPISIGGEEYDLSNIQTLCIKCNKVKTKEDLKKIALYRKRHKSQTQLNSEEAVSIPPNPKGIGYP